MTIAPSAMRADRIDSRIAARGPVLVPGRIAS